MLRKHISLLQSRVLAPFVPSICFKRYRSLATAFVLTDRSLRLNTMSTVPRVSTFSSRRWANAFPSRPTAFFVGATLVGFTAIHSASSLRYSTSAFFRSRTLFIRSKSSQEATVHKTSGRSPTATACVLDAGVALLPHPAKEAKGGEDAFFISPCGLYMGVADGVGGWAEVGVDPGLYSRELMAAAAAGVSKLPSPGPDAPQLLLEQAHAATRARGSSTACIICIENTRIHASNLGDSGFMIVRSSSSSRKTSQTEGSERAAPPGTLGVESQETQESSTPSMSTTTTTTTLNNKSSTHKAPEKKQPSSSKSLEEEGEIEEEHVGYVSPQQQHEFNFPYQLGSPDSMSDSPQAAQRFTLEVSPGDIIVLATDGLFDNVYPDEAAALLKEAKEKGLSAGDAASVLAQHAKLRASDPTHLTPFAYGAQQLGYRYYGGKMDDITVLCAYVVAAAE